MSTRNYIQERGVNFIKLPSKDSVLNNLRYLLSAMTLVIGIFGVIVESQKINLDISFMLFLILLSLSGVVLALTSHKNIIQPYKNFKNMPLFIIVHHIIITVLWGFGWIMGFLILTIIVIQFLKI